MILTDTLIGDMVECQKKQGTVMRLEMQMTHIVMAMVLVVAGVLQACEPPGESRQAIPVAEYYVAVDGDDMATGTMELPWKSLTRALDELAGSPARPDGGVTIWVRGGDYFVEETIVLGSRHSGTAENPVRIRAYPGEQPVFIGGRKLSGWSLDEGNVYKTRLADIESGNWHFEQLFENGIRQTEARFPNEGYLRSGEPTDQLYTEFTFQQGQLPEWRNYEGAQVSIWAYANWFENIVPITHIDYETRVIRTVTLSKGSRKSWTWPANSTWIKPRAICITGRNHCRSKTSRSWRQWWSTYSSSQATPRTTGSSTSASKD
jgi:hypothetical protein